MVLREMRQLIVLYLHGIGFIGLQGYHANRNWSKAAREQPQLWAAVASESQHMSSFDISESIHLWSPLPAASAPRWTCGQR